jgi:four helix bundle protein
MRDGLALALWARMAGVGTFRELGAWKLAYELRRSVVALCWRVLRARDFELHRQLRNAARSGPSNIAEGFARYKHKDFARFVRVGKGSEVELLNHFQEAFDEGYLTKLELATLEHKARKAIKAANGLIRYLDSTPDFE